MKDRKQQVLDSAEYASLEQAKSYEERAISELRGHGYRITMPRVQVIRALGDTPKALSAYAIHEKILSSGGKIDVVSVYRILATLEEIGLVHHIGIVDGYFPCRTTDCRSHFTEVIVCDACGAVTELSLPESVIKTLESQAKEHSFILSGIKIELSSSLCSGCED